MPTLETIRRIRVQQVSEGAAEVRRDLQGLADSQQRVADTAQAVAVVTDIASRRQLSAAAAFDRVRKSVDDSFKAQQALERGMSTLDRAFQQGIADAATYERTVGLLQARYAKAATDADAFAAAQARANAAAKASVQASVDRQSIVPNRGADIAAYGTELDRLRAKFNPLFAAGQEYRTTLTEISQAAKIGAISEREYEAALTRTKDAFADRVRAMKASGPSRGGQLRPDQVQNLMFQGNDVLTSLAGGISPATVAFQQGPQIAQVFGGPGGASVKGAFSQAASAAGAFFTRIGVAGVAFGGLAVAAGVGVAALLSYESAQARLQRAIEGTGRAAGVSRGQLDALAQAGAQSGHLGLGDARTAASGFAQAGVSGDLIGRAVGDTSRFGRFTGQSTDDAGKALADALRDPTQGASALDKVFGNLNDRLRTSIDDLEAQGRHAEAQRVLLDAFEAALKRTTDASNMASEAMREVKRWSGSLLNSVGSGIEHLLGRDASPQDQMKYLREQVRPYATNNPLAIGNWYLPNVDEKIARLQKQVEDAAKPIVDPAFQARDAAADRLSGQVGPLIRSLMPEIAKAQTATNTLELLRTAMSDPLVLGKLGDGIGASQVQGAFGRQAVIAANDDPMARMRQDYDLAVDSIKAVTLAERTAVEARRAELQVLRDTGDVTRAALAARQAENQAIEAANKAARDRAIEAKQQLGMVGMTSYERSLAELDARYKGPNGIFAEDSATRSQMTTAMQPVANDLRSAGELLVGALREIAEKAKTSFLSVDGKALGNPYGTLAGVRIGGAGSADAIKAIESGGNYGALGPVTRTGDRAYGAYQVMGANIPSWSRAALGYSLTPSQFLADKGAQDAVFNHQFGMSMARYGNASDAASVWFTGRPLAQGAGARDVLGTTGATYVDRFNAAMGGARPITVRGSNDNLPAQATVTTMDSDRRAYSDSRAAIIGEAQIGPINDSTNALMAQRAALQAQITTFGQSTAAITAASMRQQLLTGYEQQHIPVTAAMTAQVDQLAKGYGASADAAERASLRQRDLTQAMDDVREAGRGFLDPFAQALMHGTSLVSALKQGVEAIGSKLMSRAEDSLIDALFGRSGTFGAAGGGGGIFGGGLASLFTGGFKFASGGIMTGAGPMPLHAYASGGIANAPQLAMFGEGRTPEAYVPLPDGKRIPVAMAGGAQGGQSVTDARSYSFDLRGSDLTEAQVDARFRKALDERDRKFGDNVRNVNRRAS